jgi:peptidoglycan-associated lipoprotein
MKRSTWTATVLTGMLCLLVLAGCPKKAVVTPAPEPAPAPEPTPPPPPEFNWNLRTIHFDFDRSDIRTGDAVILTDNYGQISAAEADDQTPDITIEGYCDPIGTAEYNMALGMRRAEAAKAYLVKLGADAGQFTTISYGEEKLVTQDPAQYELDRRCEFKVAK